jgi:hypothetical protein
MTTETQSLPVFDAADKRRKCGANLLPRRQTLATIRVLQYGTYG